jgi:hypothetical protein
VAVSRRTRGSPEAAAQVLATASGASIDQHRASIERLNATLLCACLACWPGAPGALAHREAVLSTGMFLVGIAPTTLSGGREFAASVRCPRGGGGRPHLGHVAFAGLDRPSLDHGRAAALRGAPPRPGSLLPRPTRRGRPPKALRRRLPHDHHAQVWWYRLCKTHEAAGLFKPADEGRVRLRYRAGTPESDHRMGTTSRYRPPLRADPGRWFCTWGGGGEVAHTHIGLTGVDLPTADHRMIASVGGVASGPTRSSRINAPTTRDHHQRWKRRRKRSL